MVSHCLFLEVFCASLTYAYQSSDQKEKGVCQVHSCLILRERQFVQGEVPVYEVEQIQSRLDQDLDRYKKLVEDQNEALNHRILMYFLLMKVRSNFVYFLFLLV